MVFPSRVRLWIISEPSLDFVQSAAINACQGVQPVNARNSVLGFDVMQTAWGNQKCRLTVLFRNVLTRCVNLTEGQSALLTDSPQFRARF